MFNYNDIVIDKHKYPFADKTIDTCGFRGGRSSKKTTDIESYVYLNALVKNESALVIRESLIMARNSIFKDMVLFAEKHDIKLKKVIENPQPHIVLENGAEIFFRGFDKSYALKGIKSKVPIGILWFEEANDIRFTKKEVEEVQDSLRDVKRLKTIYSYNPKNPNHWLKGWEEDLKDNERLIVSTIYDNPYSSKQMIERIEALKDVAPAEYLIRAEGQWANLGDVVYNITASNYYEDIDNSFHTISIGVDLGDVNATTFVAIGFKNNYKDVYVLENYHYANKENDVKKSWNDYADDFEKFYKNIQNKYRTNLITAQFETASGGVGFKQMILERGIRVKGVKKDKISERIMYTNYLINANKLWLNKKHRLTEEMVNAQRDLTSKNNDYYRLDLNDHSINAFEYALGKYIKYMGIL